jgi:lactate dehydrogenase-like 2-hydroxyacid dehydrogenase
MKIANPTIVFLDVSTVGELENLINLAQLGNYTSYEYTLPHQRFDRLKDCQIVITNKVIIDKEIIDSCPSLQLICIAATGMNNVDCDYARKKGLVVKNVAGYSTESVAQSTFSMLLYLIHQTGYYDRYVKSGDYSISKIFTHFGPAFRELNNKRFGIIGLGTIGKRVATIAQAFGAEVAYYSTSGMNLDTGFKHLPLSELLSTSDIVSVHCPLNENTTNLIDEVQLKLMKPTSYLINTGRGGIVNEKALADAIDNGLISGAAIDVLTKEPIDKENPLCKVRNKDRLLITPHIAWTSLEARTLLVERIISNIREFLISSDL